MGDNFKTSHVNKSNTFDNIRISKNVEEGVAGPSEEEIILIPSNKIDLNLSVDDVKDQPVSEKEDSLIPDCNGPKIGLGESVIGWTEVMAGPGSRSQPVCKVQESKDEFRLSVPSLSSILNGQEKAQEQFDKQNRLELRSPSKPLFLPTFYQVNVVETVGQAADVTSKLVDGSGSIDEWLLKNDRLLTPVEKLLAAGAVIGGGLAGSAMVVHSLSGEMTPAKRFELSAGGILADLSLCMGVGLSTGALMHVFKPKKYGKLGVFDIKSSILVTAMNMGPRIGFQVAGWYSVYAGFDQQIPTGTSGEPAGRSLRR